LGSAHRYHAKKSEYPTTRKLASPGENVQFFVFNYRTEVFNGELLDKIDEGSIFLMDKNGN
jgi:hypothetical protein